MNESRSVGTFYAELNQIDPDGSPSPGCAHIAGEVAGFATAEEAAEAARQYLGKPLPADIFYPCCDWQKIETPVSYAVVYSEDADGNRAESDPILVYPKELPGGTRSVGHDTPGGDSELDA